MRGFWRSTGRFGSGPGRGQAGFSLAEVLVVVALIGIVVLAVMPAFGDYLRSWRARSAADEMMAQIRGARQMAITMRQDITVTFTPDPANTYSYYHPIKKATQTVKLPPQIRLSTNPTTSYAPVFKVNGSISNPSSPSVSSPTTNYVELRAIINGSRTDRYRFGFSTAGQVRYSVTR